MERGKGRLFLLLSIIGMTAALVAGIGIGISMEKHKQTVVAPVLYHPAALDTAIVQYRSCYAHKVGSHWSCITPGSYCSIAAHKHYGYARTTHRQYRCLRYSNGRWRWKRV